MGLSAFWPAYAVAALGLSVYILLTGPARALPRRTWIPVVGAIAVASLVGSRNPLLGLVWGAAILALPGLLARLRAARRQRRIRDDLPFALDLLGLAVRAGQDLGAAWARVPGSLGAGPVAEAFARALALLRMGRTRREVLEGWGADLALPAARRLGASLAQAQEEGSSLGSILQEGARELREETYLAAEARAQRAPVAMIFPLVLCVMPGVFVVLLGPVLVRILG